MGWQIYRTNIKGTRKIKVIVYITFNDQPSGIYSSQVIDVIKYLRNQQGISIDLVSLVSVRKFWINRSVIKEQLPGAIVLPMIPKLKNWRLNYVTIFILFLIKRPKAAICRGVISSRLALGLKSIFSSLKVVYDGRGAEYEQLNEYKMVSDKSLIQGLLEAEKSAVLKTDFQMSVTESLVEYWRQKFSYNRSDYVVIPCTINSKYLHGNQKTGIRSKLEMGYNEDDIVLVYSGSISGWQSFNMISDFMETHLNIYPNIKLIMLTKTCKEVLAILNRFSASATQKWCNEDEVFSYLSIADYGLLLRENTNTNRVASPVKFAEYIAAGLNVIISENLGDYSSFVLEQKCGYVYSNCILSLECTRRELKSMNRGLAIKYLSKESKHISEKYSLLLAQL